MSDEWWVTEIKWWKLLNQTWPKPFFHQIAPKEPSNPKLLCNHSSQKSRWFEPFPQLVQFQTFLFFIPFKTLNSLISPTFCYYQILNIVPQKRLPCIFSHTFLPQAPFKIQPFHNFISNPNPIFPLNIHPNKTNHKYM